MSMSESSWVEVDLDNPAKANQKVADDFEIIEEGFEPEPRPPVEPPATGPTQAATEDEEDSEGEGEGGKTGKRNLTRTQRLKMARDNYREQLEAEKAAREAAEKKIAEYEKTLQQSAVEGYDFFLTTIDNEMKAARHEWDAAFESGDKGKLFEVQQRISALAARKEQAEVERRRLGPTKRESGGEAQPPTPQTTSATDRPAPQQNGGGLNRLAMNWLEENKGWFNKDRVATAAAGAIEQELLADGHDVNDPEFYEELTRRLHAEFPAKFGQTNAAQAPQRQPVVNTRQTTQSPGKTVVRLTAEELRTIERLGISKEKYARQKAAYEKAQQGNNGYVEI